MEVERFKHRHGPPPRRPCTSPRIELWEIERGDGDGAGGVGAEMEPSRPRSTGPRRISGATTVRGGTPTSPARCGRAPTAAGARRRRGLWRGKGAHLLDLTPASPSPPAGGPGWALCPPDLELCVRRRGPTSTWKKEGDGGVEEGGWGPQAFGMREAPRPLENAATTLLAAFCSTCCGSCWSRYSALPICILQMQLFMQHLPETI
jgi:hypothetical protein